MKRTIASMLLAAPLGALAAHHMMPEAQAVGSIGGCEWNVTVTTSSATSEAVCAAGYAIGGGCLSNNSSAQLLGKAGPFENSDEDNHPDANEAFDNLTLNTGWYCRYDTSATTTAFAMCCT